MLSVARSDTCRLLPVHVPLGGLVIAAVGGVVSPVVVALVVPVVDVVVPVVDVVVAVAVVVVADVDTPDGYVGLTASLMIVTGADTARLPAASTATAFTM